MLDSDTMSTFKSLMAAHMSVSEDFAWSDFEAAYATCESPIERKLLPHLFWLAPGTMGHRYGGTMDTPLECKLYVQPKVGIYRLDFALHCRAAFQANDELRINVECDGHEFHDATKEAAARDKARDVALQTEGYRVLRFTGSQIHQAPAQCASKVTDLIDQFYTRKLVTDVAAALTSEQRLRDLRGDKP